MTGEIAHVVYAARLLTHLQDQVRHPSYWIGTLFPDIYRIGHSRRFPTHPRGVSLSTLVGNNDFFTGMRAHSWIDETKRVYFLEHAVFETLPWHPLLPFALELVEDELLYSSYEDWEIVHRALSTVHADEERIIHNRPHIQAWHAILQSYFRTFPSEESRDSYMESLQLSLGTRREVHALVEELKKSGAAEKFLGHYIQSLEHIIV